MLNTTAIIVTYGNRFHLLKQVCNSAFSEGISKIIVVDNNSQPESREQLKVYEQELGADKIKVLYLDDNYGSAGGFKRGLEEAYRDDECEYILTLDDDNVLSNNFLTKIENILKYLDNIPKNKLMLSIYRPMRSDIKKVVEQGWIKGYRPNNFMGINFLDYLRNKIIKINENKYFFPLQPMEVAAMGGLFFHKSVIDFIGYPNEDLFLYADDHEYTYRFVKNGGKILMCGNITIKDIDQTSKNKNGEDINFFHKDFPKIKLYYAVRNHVYLSKQFISFKPFFYGNMLFVSILFFTNIIKTPFRIFLDRYKLYLKAVSDGLNDRLGKRY
jgi:GT2 family glycosyltransferase